MTISSVVVLGAGSAGFMAALTLKCKLPHLSIRVVRSPDIGVIGVGEATTVVLTKHLFDFLKLKPQDFYKGAQPTWKMGIRFLWGPRKDFVYTFSYEFEKRLPRRGLKWIEGTLSVGSSSFVVRGRASVGKADVRMEALLQRERGAMPVVLWQRKR